MFTISRLWFNRKISVELFQKKINPTQEISCPQNSIFANSLKMFNISFFVKTKFSLGRHVCMTSYLDELRCVCACVVCLTGCLLASTSPLTTPPQPPWCPHLPPTATSFLSSPPPASFQLNPPVPVSPLAYPASIYTNIRIPPLISVQS